jgi:hypothetical protein
MSHRRGSTPRLTDRLAVGRNVTLTLSKYFTVSKFLMRRRTSSGSRGKLSKQAANSKQGEFLYGLLETEQYSKSDPSHRCGEH